MQGGVHLNDAGNYALYRRGNPIRFKTVSHLSLRLRLKNKVFSEMQFSSTVVRLSLLAMDRPCRLVKLILHQRVPQTVFGRLRTESM